MFLKCRKKLKNLENAPFSKNYSTLILKIPHQMQFLVLNFISCFQKSKRRLFFFHKKYLLEEVRQSFDTILELILRLRMREREGKRKQKHIEIIGFNLTTYI